MTKIYGIPRPLSLINAIGLNMKMSFMNILALPGIEWFKLRTVSGLGSKSSPPNYMTLFLCVLMLPAIKGRNQQGSSTV